jgi:hypothetical protein
LTHTKTATYRNPETGEHWVLPRRFAPPGWERVAELCATCGRTEGYHCRCQEKKH